MKKRIGLSVGLVLMTFGGTLIISCYGRDNRKAVEAMEVPDIPKQFFYVKDTVLIEHSPERRYWVSNLDSLSSYLSERQNSLKEAGVDILWDPIPPIIPYGPNDFFWVRECDHSSDCEAQYLELYRPKLKAIGMSLDMNPTSTISNEWGYLDDLEVINKHIMPALANYRYSVVDSGDYSLLAGKITYGYAKIKIPNIREHIGIIILETEDDAFLFEMDFKFDIPFQINGEEYDVLRKNGGPSKLYFLIQRSV